MDWFEVGADHQLDYRILEYLESHPIEYIVDLEDPEYEALRSPGQICRYVSADSMEYIEYD